jgi:hypothetical protein
MKGSKARAVQELGMSKLLRGYKDEQLAQASAQQADAEEGRRLARGGL